MKNLKKTLTFLMQHPLGKKKKLKTILRFFCWQLISRFFPNGLTKKWIGGIDLFLKKSLHSATANYYVGLQEFDEMSFMLHTLNNNDLFIDIGANIGVYSLLASKLKKANTFAFEPAPETIKILERNIIANNLELEIKLFSCALGDNEDIVNFTNNQDSVNHINIDQFEMSMKVEMRKLDDILDRIPILIKIDTEGFEFKILQGANRIINNIEQKAIILEMNGSGNRYGNKDSDIHSYLSLLGYKVYSYDPFKRNLIDSGCFKNGNNIYIKDINYIQNRIEKSPVINIYGTKC